MARIVIVEDEQDDREAFSAALTREGHEVASFENAEAALEYLGNHEADLVLTDLLLPGIDGAEFCRDLRHNPATENLPIVMITSMAEHMGIHITPEDAKWAPLDRYIEKGTPLATLARTVNELLAVR